MKEAQQVGEIMGRIEILQEVLSISQPTLEELLAYDLPQLATLAKELQQQLGQ